MRLICPTRQINCIPRRAMDGGRQKPAVIAREGGRPSTPRLLGSIAAGILDRPVIGERKRRRPSDGYAGDDELRGTASNSK
jgi:hypothetical protein